MTTTFERPVLVHSCLMPPDVIVRNFLTKGVKYLQRYENELKKEGRYFRVLPFKCNCRKFISRAEAERYVASQRDRRYKNEGGGYAKAEVVWVLDNHGQIVQDTDAIWMSQQVRVPRIDLITKAHIERAYTDDRAEVREAAMEYIEDIHTMHQEELIKLIKPFREDPTNGRLIEPFGADNRTLGGHE